MRLSSGTKYYRPKRHFFACLIVRFNPGMAQRSNSCGVSHFLGQGRGKDFCLEATGATRATGARGEQGNRGISSIFKYTNYYGFLDGFLWLRLVVVAM
jgi:hypothetical protein